MRLVCPSCDAQYEVDAAMIPASGRDVQCSNCGRTWFQVAESAVQVREAEAAEAEEAAADGTPDTDGHSGDGLGEEAARFFAGELSGGAAEADPDRRDGEDPPDETVEDTDEPAPDTRDESEQIGTAADVVAAEPRDADAEDVAAKAETADAGEAEAKSEPEKDDDNGDDMEADAAESDAAARAADPDGDGDERPKLDPKVLGILRAEAEREIAARRAEAERGLEEQDELLLEIPDRDVEPDARQETHMRTARLRGETEEAGSGGERSHELLPDIEDINATLTATTDRDEPATPQDVARSVQKQRVGFRLGFSVTMGAVAAVILIYLFAPEISRAIPPLEPTLAAYVDWANGFRLAFDGFLARSVEMIGTAGDTAGE